MSAPELRIVASDDNVDPEQLTAHPDNWRIHSALQEDAVEGAIDEIGFVRRVLVNRATGHVLDGHLRVLIAIKRGYTVPVDYVQLNEDEELRALALLDSTAALAGTDDEKVKALIAGQSVPSNASIALMFNHGLNTAAIIAHEANKRRTRVIEDADYVPPDRETHIKWGDLFALGDHRVLCGDCTKADNIERLFDGVKPDCLLTDPPYCSGGFQEAGRSGGSVGTRGTERVANDTLSTRGYQALLRATIELLHVGIAYVFTDWRMWNNLFDVMESRGFGVRNMIVWDKGTPGMGVGWRMQHELIMAAVKVSLPFDPKKAQGNVIQCQRTGNEDHPTQKPVELLQTILDVTDMANVVVDPMLGSGSTLIACEAAGRTCYALELSPRYVQTTIDRWERATSGRAEKIG